MVALFGPHENWQTTNCIEKAHEDAIWSILWTAENKIISGSNDECVNVRGAEDLGLVHQFEGHSMGVVGIASSGPVLAAGCIDSVIRVWDVEKMSAIGTIDAGPVECWTVALNHDATLLASGSHKGNVNIWRLQGDLVDSLPCGASEYNNYLPGGLSSHESQAAIKQKEAQKTINSKFMTPAQPNFPLDVAFSPDNKWLAASGIDGCISVFDLSTQTLVRRLQGHYKAVRKISFSPDSSRILSACDDSRLMAFDFTRQEKYIDSYSGHTGWVMCCQYAPDNSNRFASASADGTVKVWDTTTSGGHVLASLDEHQIMVSALAYSPDATKLVSGAENGSIQMHSLLSDADKVIATDLEPISFSDLRHGIEQACDSLSSLIIPTEDKDHSFDDDHDQETGPNLPANKRHKPTTTDDSPMDLAPDNSYNRLE